MTAGVIFHEAVFDRDEAHTEPPEMMAQAVVLLASEPLDRVTGRVCYSQQILREFGWIDGGRGTGIDTIGFGLLADVSGAQAFDLVVVEIEDLAQHGLGVGASS